MSFKSRNLWEQNKHTLPCFAGASGAVCVKAAPGTRSRAAAAATGAKMAPPPNFHCYFAHSSSHFREPQSKTSINCPRKRHQTKCGRLSEWWCFFSPLIWRGGAVNTTLGTDTHKPSSPSAVRPEALKRRERWKKRRHETALLKSLSRYLTLVLWKRDGERHLRALGNHCPISVTHYEYDYLCLTGRNAPKQSKLNPMQCILCLQLTLSWTYHNSGAYSRVSASFKKV